MVPKTSNGLSCLLPARFGFGSSHRVTANSEKHAEKLVPLELERARPNVDIGESPIPVHRSFPPSKRASLTTFFAFSSKRKPTHGVSPQSIPGAWLSGTGQLDSDVHTISPSAIPSPLRADEEEYYYSYYTSLSVSPHQQDLDSHPVDQHASHTHIQHPYAYSKPVPSLRHAASQTFHHGGHHQAHNSQPHLKTSFSTPNLASEPAPPRVRSIFKKRTSSNKRQERWLSAESWWDALLSPSPRFKVNQAPRTSRVIRDSINIPVQGEPNRILGVSFPSLPAARPRPRAVSVGTNIKPTHSRITRSRSATDLGQPSTSAIPSAGFQPALGTLVDEPVPMPNLPPTGNTESPSPDPPLSLEQVIDEGRAFEEQRAQWKRQAYKSIGNRHTRSISRARSKSLGEKHAQAQTTSEGSKSHLNLEFLAARSLLGSQTTKPTVHIIKPSNSSSSHSKAYSHSHSQSAYSSAQTSHSHVYSHSHSHSLTVSNSSKSSRNPREHARSGSWSRTAFLKAGSLCGIAQDDSAIADEKIPSSSRADAQASAHNITEGVIDVSRVSHRVPIDEVGIAISPTPPPEGSSTVAMPTHSHVSGIRHQTDRECRLSPKRTYRTGYAGPHPSAIDSNLPELGAASNVSLRHRFPPRPTIYPPIPFIVHPYGSPCGQPERVDDKATEGAPSSNITEGHVTVEPGAERTPYPHVSLSNTDFERYGVGEALVYSSPPPTDGISEVNQADVDLSPTAEVSPPEETQSLSCNTVVLHHEESDTASSAMNSPPSMTSSTIQMVMSAFNDPDDLDEFQDLFYKPQPISGDQRLDSTVAINHLPTDVHSSASSSPLTHLVRKLSEGVNGTPSDPIGLQDHPSSESVTKFVFMELAPSMDSSSQVHLPIQGGEESILQPVVVIPEDVDSSCTMSVLGSPSPERQNITFGYPIKRDQFEPATAPSFIQAPTRVSTHLSVQNENAVQSPPTKRHGLTAEDALRSSYVTTSDVSRISGLFDFPLPPSALPGEESERNVCFGSTASAGCRRRDGAATELADGAPSTDVRETLQALRSRVTSDASFRTFGGSDDMDFITQLHQVNT